MLKVQSESRFDEIYESLGDLYKKDPDQFEDLRQELISAAINSYPERFQQRARGLQFVLDCELNKHKNPVMRMNRMVELFWEKVYEFQTVVSDPIYSSDKKNVDKKQAKIIKLFKSPSS